VSYCSFDSFKEYQKTKYSGNKLINEIDQLELKIQTPCSKKDRPRRYRDQILKLNSFTALKLNYSKKQSLKRAKRTKIKQTHPFYLVALLKKQFGSFNSFESAKYSLQNIQKEDIITTG
jgi:hypothetical protein